MMVAFSPPFHGHFIFVPFWKTGLTTLVTTNGSLGGSQAGETEFQKVSFEWSPPILFFVNETRPQSLRFLN